MSKSKLQVEFKAKLEEIDRKLYEMGMRLQNDKVITDKELLLLRQINEIRRLL